MGLSYQQAKREGLKSVSPLVPENMTNMDHRV
jgi:hypothetical protein